MKKALLLLIPFFFLVFNFKKADAVETYLRLMPVGKAWVTIPLKFHRIYNVLGHVELSRRLIENKTIVDI